MERREIAESALKQLCELVGVAYSTESTPVGERVAGAWFLETASRGRVNIMAWCPSDSGELVCITHPLGTSLALNLTHEQAYDQCWMACSCIRLSRKGAVR
jgi:hypothetical protein